MSDIYGLEIKMADQVLTIGLTEFTALLDQLKQNFNDGLAAIEAIESSLAPSGATQPSPPAPPPPTIIAPGTGAATTGAGIWTVDNQSHILLNGKMAYKGWQTQKLVQTPDGSIYIFGMSSEGWYKWNGTDFVSSPAPAGV
jgi:hypothetical protein